MNELVQVDARGHDVTIYTTLVQAVSFDDTGRITGEINQAWPYTQARIDAGERWLRGSGEYDWIAGQSPFFVDPATGTLTERPVFAGTPSRTELPVRSEAIVLDVPACLVRYAGPLTGSFEHLGGDLAVGFSVPGIYQVDFEPFPCLPVSFSLVVTP